MINISEAANIALNIFNYTVWAMLALVFLRFKRLATAHGQTHKHVRALTKAARRLPRNILLLDEQSDAAFYIDAGPCYIEVDQHRFADIDFPSHTGDYGTATSHKYRIYHPLGRWMRIPFFVFCIQDGMRIIRDENQEFDVEIDASAYPTGFWRTRRAAWHTIRFSLKTGTMIPTGEELTELTAALNRSHPTLGTEIS